MARSRIVALSVLLVCALILSGCKKKKPPLPPPQAQAPTINIPPIEPLPPAAEPEPSEAAPDETENKPTPEVVNPKPKTRVARKPKKKPEQPTRIIIDDTEKEEANVPPPLVADTSADAEQRRRQTESLLNSSERDVASLHRQLSNEEQAIVRHINSYVDQAREALKQGDLDRAHGLAVKAHLLSDSLKK